jgi:ParB family chromosome partitioning protein
MEERMETRAVSEIVVGSRHRKDLGDIKSLAASIEEIGLLHPIVVMPDNTLLVGERRLEAFKLLGREEIPVTVAPTPKDVAEALRCEAEENTCRKDFAPSEAVAIGLVIEEEYRKIAKENQRHDLREGEEGRRPRRPEAYRGDGPLRQGERSRQAGEGA